MAEVAFPSGYEHGLPPRALRLVRERRRQILRQATGRVLDLGGCAGHADAYTGADSAVVLATPEEHGDRLRRRAAAAPVSVDVREGTVADIAGEEAAPFDTVVSVLQLSRADPLEPLLRSIGSIMSERGRLLFLEPTAHAGFTGHVQRLLSPAARLWTSRRPDRDLPASVRAAGLLMTDCERFTMPVPWPYRSWVQGVAQLPVSSVGTT
jgi:SAM-dependent methyltransferase